MLLLAVFVLLQINNFIPADGIDVTWTETPSPVTAIQGQSVNITWTVDMKNYQTSPTWLFVKIYKDPLADLISYSSTGQKTVFGAYQSRASDLTLTASQEGTIVTILFTMANLDRTSDETGYKAALINTHPDSKTIESFTRLKVLVPTVITSPNPHYITVNETDTAHLVCTATGNPNPSINWISHGVLVGTGVYTTDIVGIHDDKTCNYTCIAYNGVYGAKTANVCLNVQYKPRSAVVVSDKTTVCQYDNVTLTCTSGPANPAPSSYEFYNNGILVGTSETNVYVAIATAVINKFVCVPRNRLGGSLENGSVKVTAKEKPLIVESPISVTLIEGNAIILFCNASGQPAPNITWTKVGGSTVGSGQTFTFSSIVRGDEGTYRCTASNGDECNTVSVDATVTVYYKPRNAVVISDKTTVCQNDNVTLTCTSGPANPAPSSYEFYNNGVLVGTSATNVYVAIATAVVNRFVCVSRNLLGGSLENGSVEVTAKEKPLIVTSPISTTVLEGNTLTLFCNASGQPAPYITWTKVGWSAVGNGETFTIHSVTNGAEGIYRCTASNGAECSTATAVATVTIYSQSEIKPNFKVTKDSLTVTWKKLSESVNAECTISVMKLSNGTTWLTASNTSQKTLLSCTVNELLSDTTYIAKFLLKLSQRYFNGTVYIVTAAQDFNYRLDKQKEDCNGTPYVVLGVIIALSLLVFIILISYIIWIHKKGAVKVPIKN